jgi:hypothetical protein
MDGMRFFGDGTGRRALLSGLAEISLVQMSRSGEWSVRRWLRPLMQLSVLLLLGYGCTLVVRHGLVMVMSLILVVFLALVLGSLLHLYMDGAKNCARLWSLTREQRQLYHAKNLPVYSIVPIVKPVPSTPADAPPGPPAVAAASWGQREWREFEWREFAETSGEELAESIRRRSAFSREVDGCLVQSGLPTLDDVERGGNVVVLTIRDNWSSLAARLNPVVSVLLSRVLSCCWSRSHAYTSVRYSAFGLPFPVVCVEFPTTDTASLNFGQKDDCLLLSYLHERIHVAYPKAKIVLMSTCLGGLRILNWLSRNPCPEAVVAVVLESPLASMKHMLVGLVGQPLADMTYSTFCLHVPNFRPELENQYSFWRELPDDSADGSSKNAVCKVPLLVGIIDTDPYCNRSHLSLLERRFPNLQVFVNEKGAECDGPVPHGALYKLAPYRTAVADFLKQHVLVMTPEAEAPPK